MTQSLTYYALRYSEGSMAVPAPSFVQAVQTKNMLQAEYNRGHHCEVR
jgi:hypothetical protein